MSPRAVSHCCLFAVAAAACAGAEPQLSGKSPFGSKTAAGAAGPAAASAPLEFLGYYEDRGGREFRVRDSATKKGVFLRLNERDDTFNVIVKKHDEDERTLTVEHQGRVLTLKEREAKIVSSGSAMGAQPPPMPVAGQGNVPAAVTQAVVLNPTPADERARLDSVAAEVARRRALRVQAEQQGGQPAVPPQPAPLRPN